MGALNIPAAAFRSAHEAHGALADLADRTDMDIEWPARTPLLVTDEEIDSLIEQIAETGTYGDELGNPKRASELVKALAQDWVDDPMRLPGYTYTAFFKWAQAAARLAKYGK